MRELAGCGQRQPFSHGSKLERGQETKATVHRECANRGPKTHKQGYVAGGISEGLVESRYDVGKEPWGS